MPRLSAAIELSKTPSGVYPPPTRLPRTAIWVLRESGAGPPSGRAARIASRYLSLDRMFDTYHRYISQRSERRSSSGGFSIQPASAEAKEACAACCNLIYGAPPIDRTHSFGNESQLIVAPTSGTPSRPGVGLGRRVFRSSTSLPPSALTTGPTVVVTFRRYLHSRELIVN